jgi:hypothetical protein
MKNGAKFAWQYECMIFGLGNGKSGRYFPNCSQFRAFCLERWLGRLNQVCFTW